MTTHNEVYTPGATQCNATTQPTLDTPRLVLRPMVLTDAPNVQKYAGTWELADKAISIPHPYEDGFAEAWIASHAPGFTARELIVFAITLRDDVSHAVGSIRLVFDSQHRDIAGIGYWLGKEFEGRGIVTEACMRVLEYGFKELKCAVIHGDCCKRNTASARVMEKIGMTYEGCLRRRGKKWGKFEDLKMYSILSEEYFRNLPSQP